MKMIRHINRICAALLVLLAIVGMGEAAAQSNWQQQQFLQQQRQMDMQRRQQDAIRQQQLRQQQEMLRQQQMRMQQQQAMQRSQRMGVGSATAPRPIPRWQPPTRTFPQAQVQRPAQRTQVFPPRAGTVYRTMPQTAVRPVQRAPAPQPSLWTRWNNRAATFLRNTFNWQRGVTVRNTPARPLPLAAPRPPSRTEIQRGFRGRFVGDRAVVTVNGRTYTVPRSMVQAQGNRAVSTRTVAARQSPSARSGAAPLRFVLSGGGSPPGGGGAVQAHSATSSLQGAQLTEHLRQLEKYGTAGFKALESGKFRYYGNIAPANRQGEMAGARLVREWDPTSGRSRHWYETVDQQGKVRSVSPKPVTSNKNHHIFGRDGEYLGRR